MNVFRNSFGSFFEKLKLLACGRELNPSCENESSNIDIFPHTRPNTFIDRAQFLENLVQLIRLNFTLIIMRLEIITINHQTYREERFARHNLGKNATDGPHVDSRRVSGCAEEQFRGAVPQRHHHVRVWLDRTAIRTSETKIGNLNSQINDRIQSTRNRTPRTLRMP